MTTEEQKAVEEFATTSTKSKQLIISNRLNADVAAYNDGLCDGIKLGAEFLSNLRNFSEPETKVAEPSEELVKKITNILKSNEKLENVWLTPKWAIIPIIDHSQFEKVATEIAALMQNCLNQEESRNISQPDVNAELLSALKKAQVFMAENIPSMRGYESLRLQELSAKYPEVSQDTYNQKAADITEENRKAYKLLEIVSEAIYNYENTKR